MKKSWSWIPLLLILFPVFALAVEEIPEIFGEPAIAYDRSIVLVSLRRADPVWIRENLSLLNSNWGIFPSLRYLELAIPGGDVELLFLRGRQEEVTAASRIAEAMDRIYPDPSEMMTLFPIPLSHLSGPSMREKLLELAPAAGLELEPGQLLLFPPGSQGSLFFRGLTSESKKLRELKTELDQARHGSAADLLSGFCGRFRQDLSAHFFTVSTYAASALLLLILHFLLCRIPWLGRQYQRWFTLIWTRLIQDVRGRDFAYDVIKNLVETAVDSVEQSSSRALGASGGPELAESSEIKKSRALVIARDLAAFRGYNPQDPEIKRLISDLIEAAVYRLHHPEQKK